MPRHRGRPGRNPPAARQPGPPARTRPAGRAGAVPGHRNHRPGPDHQRPAGGRRGRRVRRGAAGYPGAASGQAWPEAQAVHGIRPEDVATAPELATVAAQLAEVIEAADALVIYNAQFELNQCHNRIINDSDEFSSFVFIDFSNFVFL